MTFLQDVEPYTHRICYYETDRMNYTHHSNYIRFMEDARMDFFRKIGWDYDEMEKEGILSPIVEVSCKYIQHTTFPDEISIYTEVEKVGPVTVDLSYTILCKDVKIATGKSQQCFVNEKGIPQGIKKKLPGLYASLKEREKSNE